MLVDSHCHLHFLENVDLDEIISNAKDNKISELLCVATTLEQHATILDICNKYDNIAGSIGVHPNEEIKHEPSVDDILKLAANDKIIAIGETGLDYFRSKDSDFLANQQQRFINHINAAKECNKPLIVHTRDAKEDTLKLLIANNAQIAGGVLHCFTGDLDMAKRAIDIGFLISFSGIVTFKNATDLQAIAKELPLNKILIETDCPYLAPVPHRGKMNQPAYVKYVAEFLAELRQIDFADIATATTANFHNLFN